MCSGDAFVLGLVGLVFGPPAALWPYQLARWEELVDAIGRKPAGPVEPADWKVSLTRISGYAMALLGVVFTGFCLL
jgi:hypothetical protein